MSVEVVSKKKNGKVCGSCKHSLSDDEIAKSATTCPECGSTDIKKSLVVIRKAVGDEDDDLETGVVVDEDDTEEDDDEEEDDENLSLEDEEDDAVDEDDDDDEDEDEEEDEPQLVTASKSLRNHEVFNVMTACAEDIVKALDSGDSTAYEETMVEVNNVLDAAVEKWQKGHTITKSADAAGHAKLIRDRVFGIIGKEKGMPKKKEATTTITKRADLPEDVRKTLDEADAIVERDKVQHYDRLAKSFTHLGIDGPTLRKLEEDSPEAFATLKKSLETANGHIEKSEVLKSWGAPGGAEDGDNHVDQNKVAEIMKSENLTREQAEVRLMDGSAYTPTVK